MTGPTKLSRPRTASRKRRGLTGNPRRFVSSRVTFSFVRVVAAATRKPAIHPYRWTGSRRNGKSGGSGPDSSYGFGLSGSLQRTEHRHVDVSRRDRLVSLHQLELRSRSHLRLFGAAASAQPVCSAARAAFPESLSAIRHGCGVFRSSLMRCPQVSKLRMRFERKPRRGKGSRLPSSAGGGDGRRPGWCGQAKEERHEEGSA